MVFKSEAADLVQSAIEKAERSKRWTCQKAGFSPTTFQRKLAGGSEFTLGELARIANALSIPVTDLLPDDFKVSR
jgi:transcriptional regulator with XRE-family HTH domain